MAVMETGGQLSYEGAVLGSSIVDGACSSPAIVVHRSGFVESGEDVNVSVVGFGVNALAGLLVVTLTPEQTGGHGVVWDSHVAEFACRGTAERGDVPFDEVVAAVNAEEEVRSASVQTLFDETDAGSAAEVIASMVVTVGAAAASAKLPAWTIS